MISHDGLPRTTSKELILPPTKLSELQADTTQQPQQCTLGQIGGSNRHVVNIIDNWLYICKYMYTQNLLPPPPPPLSQTQPSFLVWEDFLPIPTYV